MKLKENVFNRNDPQSFEKFNAFAKARIGFVMTGMSFVNDYTVWSVRAKEYGLKIVRIVSDEFHFEPTEHAENL
jgi:hypothetical protein